MKNYFNFVFIIALLFIGCETTEKHESQELNLTAPAYLLGDFQDDYEIQYSITDSTFILLPNDIYHIKKWVHEDQYFIAQNDSLNDYNTGLWTRIDWIQLEEMDPYIWAFCLSIYDAETAIEAETNSTTDPDSPRNGCNGFPFSRMKQVATIDVNPDSY